VKASNHHIEMVSKFRIASFIRIPQNSGSSQRFVLR